MAFVFQHRLAMAVWVVACFIVAVIAPPTATLFLMPPTIVLAIAGVGLAAIVFLMPGSMARLRGTHPLLRVVPSAHRDPARPRIIVAPSSRGPKVYEPNASEADDALDLVRMDDDGGWHMPRPPA